MIVLKMVHLCTQDIASDLGWDPLKTRREKHPQTRQELS